MSKEPQRALKDQYMLRLPDGMRDRIRAAAEANGRSMNAEIVAALSEKFPEPVDPELDELLAKVQKLRPGQIERLLQELVEKDLASGRITEQDIADGLVPGFALRSVKIND
ncbi:Arc family DNA-binding protein [Brevundimonas diminuta]